MIAKEFIVKLGFAIDSSKFNKFTNMIDNVKKNSVIKSKLNLTAEKQSDELTFIRNRKSEEKEAFDARIQNLNQRIANAQNKKLTIDRIAYIKNLNDEKLRSERRYITDIAEFERQENELSSGLEKKRILERQKLNLESLQKIRRAARAVALITAGVLGSLIYSSKNTIKEVLDPKNSGKFSRDQIQTAKNFTKAKESFSKTFTTIKVSILTAILPPLTKIIIAFRQWLEINKQIITARLVDTFKAIGSVLSVIANVAFKALEVFTFLIEKVVGFKYILAGLVATGVIGWLTSVATTIFNVLAAFKAFAVFMASNPIVLLIAAITGGFVLLADEIYTTLQGGESFINDFLESKAWKFCADNVRYIINLFKELLAVFDKFILSPIGNTFTKSLDAIAKDIKKSFFGMDQDLKMKRVINLQTPTEVSRKPLEIIQVANQDSKRHNIQKTYNVTVNATNAQSSADEIASVVRREIERYDDYSSESLMNAVGVR